MTKVLVFVLAVVMVLAVAAPVAAQSTNMLMNQATVAFAASAASDTISTVWVAKNMPWDAQFNEGNPMFHGMQNNLPLMTAAMVSVDVASVVVIRQTLGRNHPKAAAITLFVMSAFRVGLASHNVMTKPNGPAHAPAINSIAVNFTIR